MKPDLRKLAILAVVVAVLAGIYLARGVLVTFLLAGIVAYVLNPVVAWLETRGVRRSLGIPIVLAGVLVVGVALVWAVVPEMIEQGRHFSERLPGYANAARERLRPLTAYLPERTQEQIDALKAQAIDSARGFLPTLASWVGAGLKGVLSSAVQFFVWLLTIVAIPVFAYFLLVDYKEIGATLQGMIPSDMRAGIANRCREIDDVLRRWLKAQLTVGFLLALIYSLGLTLLGVPLGLLIGVVGGFANMVPYLGLVVGLLPAVVLSFLDTGSWVRPLLVVGVFTLGQVLEGTVISPRIVGGEVGLPPALVLLSVLVGGEIFGFTGLLLAVPTAAAGIVMMNNLRRSYDDSQRIAGAVSPVVRQSIQRRRPRP